MLHLDEGILSALLDGELSGAEQRDVEAHLRGCAECRERLAELKGFMQESDQLITALDEIAPADHSTRPVHRRKNYRALAWAASVVLAVGLGFAGRSLLLTDRPASAPPAAPQHERARSLAIDGPAPVVTDSVAPTTREEVAMRPPAPDRRAGPSGPIPAESRAEADKAGRDTLQDDRVVRQLQPGAVSSAANQLSIRGQRMNEAVVYVDGAPPTPANRGSGFGQDSGVTVGVNAVESASDAQGADEGRKDSTALLDKELGAAQGAVAGRSQVSKLAEAPSPLQTSPATMAVPRDAVTPSAQISQAGTRVVTMEEAVRLLGGSIRLVDSLTPVRVELLSADSAIRVVYLTAGVEVWLDQRRTRTDSGNALERAEARPSRANSVSNALYWNDLRGFYLTLTGPLPVAVLEQLKARIR